MTGFEVSSNIVPEFDQEIDTYFMLDFSDENDLPSDSYSLGYLSDYENDNFIIEKLNTDDIFVEIKLDDAQV